MALGFDPARTAVLAMDCQTAIVSIYAKRQEPFLDRSRLAAGLRREPAPRAVIHVTVGFRPGTPEVSTRNRLFASVKSLPEHRKLFEGEAGRVLVERLIPARGEVMTAAEFVG